MPVQETFFEKRSDAGTIFVLKTYDASLAREAFDSMGEPALEHLREALSHDQSVDLEDIPTSADELTEFMWEEMYETAREFGQTRSFFVVRHTAPGIDNLEYVSGDWPSAEAFAEKLLAQ